MAKSTKQTPRTKLVKVLQGNYGYGWDDLCVYEHPFNQAEINRDIRDYRLNEPNVPHRVIERRVPADELFHI